MDLCVVAPSENLVRVKLKTCDDMAVVGTESQVPRLQVGTHPAVFDREVTLVERLVDMQTSKRGQPDVWIRNSGGSSVAAAPGPSRNEASFIQSEELDAGGDL